MPLNVYIQVIGTKHYIPFLCIHTRDNDDALYNAALCIDTGDRCENLVSYRITSVENKLPVRHLAV